MEKLRDWEIPGVAERASEALSAAIDEMATTPDSNIAMCHEQGKTAVYASDDGKYIIEHAPNGRISRTSRQR